MAAAQKKPLTKRITIDLPEDLHETFSTKCFLNKPRLRMNAVVLDLIREWVGKPAASTSKNDGGRGKK